MEKFIFIVALCLALAGCAASNPNTPANPDQSVSYGVTSCEAEAPDSSVDSSDSNAPSAARRMFMTGNILWVEDKPCEDVGRCGMMDGAISMTTEDTPTENNQSNFGTGYQYQWFEDGIDVWFPETEEWIHFAARDVLFHAVVEEVSGESYIVRSWEDDPWYHGGARFAIPKDKVAETDISENSILLINCADRVMETDPAQLEVYGASFAGMENSEFGIAPTDYDK